MALPNIFDQKVADAVIERINGLSADTPPLWGKMTAPQMLAHCCVTYEMVYEKEKYPPVKGIMKLILKWMVKDKVVSEKPYKKNSPTAPVFLIKGPRDFETEKARLTGFIKKTQQLGEKAFDGKESHSFGPLSVAEWNNMFYKHLDHHLKQFGK